MTRRTNTTDLVAGIVATLIGTGALAGALAMPRFTERGASPFTMPGLTPAIIGAIVTALGLLLMLRAWRGGTADSGAEPTITRWDASSARRMLFTVFVVVLYGVGLFGRLPFVPVTALFIFLFTVGSELLNEERRLSLPALVVRALILALAGAFLVRFVFTDIFLVHLPGAL
ncbi:tripartite tricarboxylate transporter TctB family protein [Acuticoccus sediminis]|nr:tripartite tricarboxylate transporter TctB family protein [Acuticoccus sediminis]